MALSSHYLYDLQETKRFLPSNARSEGDRKGRIYNTHARGLDPRPGELNPSFVYFRAEFDQHPLVDDGSSALHMRLLPETLQHEWRPTKPER